MSTAKARESAWRLSGLERRIVLPFLLLLLLVQGVSLMLVNGAIGQSATRSIDSDLQTGHRVFTRLLEQRAERLSEAAMLLASDFGFRSAVSSRDVATLSDALENHGRRIGASLVIYTDPAWHPVASTGLSIDRVAALLPVARMASMAGPAGGVSVQGGRLTLIDGRVYQLVAVPVKAPRTVGWVLMGFVLDRSVLQQLAAITDLRGAVLFNGPPTRTLLSTFTQASDALMAPTPEAVLCGRELREADRRWRSCEFALDTGLSDGRTMPPLRLVLAHAVDEALAPFERLQLTLLLLTLVGVVVFAVGSAVMARRLSRPIRGLRQAAERLSRADYDTPVRVPDERLVGDELAQLARAFESTRQAVQHREHTIGRLAYWDTLTELPNRAQFVDVLHRRLQPDAAGVVAPLAVMMLDLDRFKHVNDVLGHRLGDRLLRAVAQRLAAGCRGADMVLARLSGDEFGLLLASHGVEHACTVARALLASLDEPMQLDDHMIDLSASLGIAFAPDHATEPEALLGLVEVAMYAAKRRQLGLLVYDTSMDTRSSASLSLLSELRRAIERQELRLYVQPKVDLKTGRVLGGEALVRWLHPQRGLVPPMQFIPFAEQTGFIRQITVWMLETGVQALQRWQDAGLVMKLSINLSTRDLLDPELTDRVGRLLDRHRVSAARLCLEITESAIMDDPARALQTLQKLHELGVHLSIDDFGTGYSSLAYLKRLPVDELKIDRSFVTNMERDLDDARIVQSTIGLAHNLGLTVVAEGVETDKAWALLARLGCDEGQGYGIGRPMPSEEFLGWVRHWQAPSNEALHVDTDFAQML
ncbi:putative bifunctional diguanylate cyclase/phosphodiesterase [Sphaerotilus sp.]|uniref:putative bifunctional diguanylate cyclase/phosphodiesterase n=1 Tax=Sphaerotilus sp. TaxID=2093942 RepID=UPI0034E1D82C